MYQFLSQNEEKWKILSKYIYIHTSWKDGINTMDWTTLKKCGENWILVAVTCPVDWVNISIFTAA